MSESNLRPGVTFVGVGAIGLPMATHLLEAGFDLTCVEPGPAQRDRAAAAGLACVASLPEAPRNATVIVMVATPGQLGQVIDLALADADPSGQLWIIMSTVGPQSVTDARDRLEAAGARVVDAPVTGGVAGAKSGTLRIFCSGRPEDTAAARPFLERFGEAELVGEDVGAGQAVKVVNQHLCTVHLVAAAEALSLAEGLGLDPERVLDLVGKGAAASWMLGDRGPRMLQASPEVTSTIGIFVKDSALVAEAADESRKDVPVLRAARERLVAAADAGLVLADDSQVVAGYRADAG